MACSFVTPEDMPYLLDLHLFLSKPLRPAPTEEEVLQDMEGVYYRINLAHANAETVYGRFPQNVIDHVSDRVREIIDGCTEVIKLQKLCAKAFRKYTESKAQCKPSTESLQKANDLPREGLHPMFMGSLLGSDKLTAVAFSDRLKI
ncbi:uncharacterized protein A4U43_C03F29420 [Asparagus officinalis]|uniref:Uncharacterized protein n=1 Tax=Asparagus officinalis TaxID=4686 RepID=A0A5P1FDV3_ASPOF|nr:uncharacterized protein A4U43_C03F29420 [Asparagus officinalis]